MNKSAYKNWVQPNHTRSTQVAPRLKENNEKPRNPTHACPIPKISNKVKKDNVRKLSNTIQPRKQRLQEYIFHHLN